MAAIISTELLSYLSPVLIWIFVYALIYIVLHKVEIFKSQPVNAAIAFAASMLFVVVPFMRELVSEVIPWLVVMVLVIVVILTILMFMGYAEKDIVTWMKENTFGATISIIVFVIFLVTLAKILGPSFYQFPSPAEAGIGADFKRVLLNPKTLGTILILAIAFYFIRAIGIPMRVVKK